MGALVRDGVLVVVKAVTVARDHNNTADSGMRHVVCCLLTREDDDQREDRASLSTFNAVNGVFMSSPATLRAP